MSNVYLGWEEVNRHSGEVTSRMEIPEGWIYRVDKSNFDGEQDSVSICFVPASERPQIKETTQEAIFKEA